MITYLRVPVLLTISQMRHLGLAHKIFVAFMMAVLIA